MLFLDDKNPDFDIPYHALVVGKKLGSGGFKDCYTGLFMFPLVVMPHIHAFY